MIVPMVATPGEAKRAIYVSTYMKTHSKVKAAAASGLRDHRTYERLIDRLDTKGTLAHSPGAGRPVKYDDTMLQASYELLLAATDPMSSTEFFEQAVSAAGLQGHVDQANFYSHLRRWLKDRECTLVLTETGTVFAITKKDAEARVKHCKDMLQKYGSDVRNFIVSDETAIDEHPPPSGKAAKPA